MRCASGSETHDLASTHGLVSAVVAILGLVCGGLCHLGTVCTSFNFVNSGTHTRSISFPLGWRQDLSYVELGNILGGRSAVLALLAWAVGGMPVLEQPLRSVMTALPAWQSVIAYFDEAEQQGWIGQRLKLNQVFMACFKAPTLKPTALYSTESFDPLMNMKVPPKDQRPQADAQVTYQCHAFKSVCVCVHGFLGWDGYLSLLGNFGHAMFCSRVRCVLQRYQDASGAKRVQGGPGLKQTQLYTPEFGRALASWWMAHGPVSAGTACRNNSEYHMLTAH